MTGIHWFQTGAIRQGNPVTIALNSETIDGTIPLHDHIDADSVQRHQRFGVSPLQGIEHVPTTTSRVADLVSHLPAHNTEGAVLAP